MLSAVDGRISTGLTSVLPAGRERYLAEVAQSVRGYQETTAAQLAVARRRQHLATTHALLPEDAAVAVLLEFGHEVALPAGDVLDGSSGGVGGAGVLVGLLAGKGEVLGVQVGSPVRSEYPSRDQVGDGGCDGVFADVQGGRVAGVGELAGRVAGAAALVVDEAVVAAALHAASADAAA